MVNYTDMSVHENPGDYKPTYGNLPPETALARAGVVPSPESGLLATVCKGVEPKPAAEGVVLVIGKHNRSETATV